MSWLTLNLFDMPIHWVLLIFIGSSTICSYSLHWYLSAQGNAPSERGIWNFQHKEILMIFFIISIPMVAYTFYLLRENYIEILFIGLITFLYTAPKIPIAPFRWLSKYIIAKTFYLAFSWTYVTAFLPLMVQNYHFDEKAIYYILNRFLVILLICMLFDYKDRKEDSKNGMKNIVTYMNAKQLLNYFLIGLICYTFTCYELYLSAFLFKKVLLLSIPIIMLTMFFRTARKSQSDYFYYIFVDGLMAFSAPLVYFL